MEFEPCEITPYHSFPDQMNALAGQVTEGVAPYAVQLREREDALDDEEMVQMRSLNKEERFFNMSLEEKERVHLGNMQLPTSK